MAFPDTPAVALPDPDSRTESDGASLRAKLNAILDPYRLEIEGLRTKVGYTASADTASLDYLINRSREQLAVFGHQGSLTVAAGTTRFRFPWAVTLLGVTAAIGTAPTGAAVVLDVNKNGSTIFTTQANRPTIAVNGFSTTAEPSPDITSMVAGDYLTVDRDQIGSSATGADLTVFIRYRRS